MFQVMPCRATGGVVDTSMMAMEKVLQEQQALASELQQTRLRAMEVCLCLVCCRLNVPWHNLSSKAEATLDSWKAANVGTADQANLVEQQCQLLQQQLVQAKQRNDDLAEEVRLRCCCFDATNELFL